MQQKKKTIEKNLSLQIKKYIENNIKPYIQMDGGDIEFIDFDSAQGLVRVKLMGACVGCALSSVTLKLGVEQQLIAKFKTVTEVIMID
jgi:Fe-S cluster biogenesis protein NfuA